MMLRLATIILCLAAAGCNSKSPSNGIIGTGETPEQGCSSPRTYDQISQALAEKILPAWMEGEAGDIKPQKIVGEADYAKPTVEAVDSNTGRISCSVDLRYPSNMMALAMPVPDGLAVDLQKDHVSTRLHFDLLRQADTGERIMRVDDAEKLAEFVMNAWIVRHAREQEARDQAKRPEQEANLAGEPAAPIQPESNGAGGNSFDPPPPQDK